MEKLVEAIKEGEIVRVFESQARQEELFILRRVPEISEAAVTETKTPASRTLDLTSKYKDGLRRDVPRVETWRKAPYKRNNVVNELKENFHWDILKKRRVIGLSRKQLANRVGESEDKLKIVESGNLPEDNFSLVIKIEQALQINLRKDKPLNSGVTLAELQKMDEPKARFEMDKASGLDKEKTRSMKAVERVKAGKDEREEKEESVFGEDIELIE